MYYSQTFGQYYERGRAESSSSDWHAIGPRDSIGDMLRWDDVHSRPGCRMASTRAYSPDSYVSSRNLDETSQCYGIGWQTGDDDGDGIPDERDERDFWFTQTANFMTTRSHNLTIEIVAQLTEPFYYPGTPTAGQTLPRGSYKTKRIYTQKHLILLVDRSTTLRIVKDAAGNPGPCDFTGPVRILGRRWAHMRK